MSAKRVLAVIPARGNSKGVPRKNLKPLLGRPLLAHMIEAATRARGVDRLIVSTEDDEIAAVARDHGAEVLAQPQALAEDGVPMIAVTKHVMDTLAAGGWEADIVVQLAATCPFVPPAKIEEAIQYLRSGETDCAVSLKRIEHEHPYRAKRLLDGQVFESFLKDRQVETYLQRQSLPPLYCTSGAIYAWTRQLLSTWNGKDFCFGARPKAVLVSDREAVNIDRPIDFAFAEFFADRESAPPRTH